MHSYSSTTFIFIDCTAHSCGRKISTLANRIGLSEAMAVKIMSAITEHSRNDKQGFFNGVFDLSHDCSLGHVTHNDFTGRSEPKKKGRQECARSWQASYRCFLESGTFFTLLYIRDDLSRRWHVESTCTWAGCWSQWQQVRAVVLGLTAICVWQSNYTMKLRVCLPCLFPFFA